jgi:DNA-binding MarR family transcriptional regulator
MFFLISHQSIKNQLFYIKYYIYNRNIAINCIKMGKSKIDQYDAENLKLAELAKALAHPARIAILQHLLKADACICGDIVEVLNLAQSTVSQHLKELKEAGLIKGTIEGASVCYCIDERGWNQAKIIFSDFFRDINFCNKNFCC